MRSLPKYAPVSVEALQRHQAERDPARKRRTAVGPGAREDRHPFLDRPGRGSHLPRRANETAPQPQPLAPARELAGHDRGFLDDQQRYPVNVGEVRGIGVDRLPLRRGERACIACGLSIQSSATAS